MRETGRPTITTPTSLSSSDAPKLNLWPTTGLWCRWWASTKLLASLSSTRQRASFIRPWDRPGPAPWRDRSSLPACRGLREAPGWANAGRPACRRRTGGRTGCRVRLGWAWGQQVCRPWSVSLLECGLALGDGAIEAFEIDVEFLVGEESPGVLERRRQVADHLEQAIARLQFLGRLGLEFHGAGSAVS